MFCIAFGDIGRSLDLLRGLPELGVKASRSLPPKEGHDIRDSKIAGKRTYVAVGDSRRCASKGAGDGDVISVIMHRLREEAAQTKAVLAAENAWVNEQASAYGALKFFRDSRQHVRILHARTETCITRGGCHHV